MAIARIAKKRNGTYIVQFNGTYSFKELGPYATRRQALSGARKWADQYRQDDFEARNADYNRRLTTAGLDHFGVLCEDHGRGPILFGPPTPIRKPSGLGGFLTWPIVEIGGLPVVLNWSAVFGLAFFAFLLWLPGTIGENGQGDPVPFTLGAKAIIGGIALSFSSPLIWQPIRKLLAYLFFRGSEFVQFLLRILARVAGVGIVVGAIGRVAGWW